ncbi:TlpA disulfide reductase family protein [Polynucleobacter sp. MWH-Svant-W18]|jgi:thiol-disulfide isomerase/thioredoxin|uniref:TlpA family protein disulfide reductase n=1 Tax=Polynucleobacter sp. MWH-Svant-W18 TaxID=1855909 RepID=UPI001BFD602B|nr:TlpA disulfide reductase family protein [Polynucleobacter sp. MWH-Svant-W18]QWD77441.1 TlpA family protein disulfide reductase [Polynucleobacter sp. MWH-Svant-W18]
MKKYLLAFVLAAGLMSLAYADKPGLKSYQMGDWSTLVKSANGSPIAIHFWGVTCPACVKEMPLWGSFLKGQPNAKVIFIQVDDVSIESMQKMLAKAGLDKANNYYIAGSFDERLRYEIDPKWYGETPTTIFIDQKGKATRQTGLIDFQKLKSFLNAGVPLNK